jgi:asparagine synthase (glutamine-hydrolysing)
MASDEAVARFDDLIHNAVALRMRADVPMGAFLSGGIDSSVIVALMQRQSARQVRSFSIGFEDAAFDESRHAAEVAKHLGTDHLAITVTAHEALEVVPLLSRMYDEPFADSSQIPTYLLAKLTREHVTVALSGDGGDEVFSGYTRYLVFDELWGRLRQLPRPIRRAAATWLPRVPGAVWRVAGSLAPEAVAEAVSPHRVRRLIDAFGASSGHDFYRSLVMFWPPSGDLAGDPSIFFEQHEVEHDFAHPVLGMGFVDLGSYLPEDILVKVDRATMAVGLEGRIPLLDHRIIEQAASLPMELRVTAAGGKQVLRRILDRYVPKVLIDRPKQGFAIPLHEWLRGPLLPWATELLADRTTAVAGLVDWVAVERAWEEHTSGRDNHAYRLWIILMLQAWAREWRPV